MIGLLQRVTEASVSVDGQRIATIGPGVLGLIGVERDDGTPEVARLARRILTYRLFADESGRMNKSVLELKRELLLVPQFTLAADTRKGTRASFTRSAPPSVAQPLFDRLLDECRRQLPSAVGGIFGADMQVALVNDGPVTFWLQS